VDQKGPREKRVWRPPEIVNVGAIAELTDGPDGNLRDNTTLPQSYEPGVTPPGDDCIEFEDR
jgi:hypothetical protein